MENEKKAVGLLKYLLSFIVLLSIILCPKRVVYADDVTYSTTGGTWKQVNEKTWTMDKDGDGTSDITLVKEGNAWKYIFTVADDKASYYAWEEQVPDGYTVVGKGERSNPTVNTMTTYSHTPNIGDDGVQNGNYANNLNLNDVVTLPGADKLHVVLTYAGESVSYDYVCAWEGSQPTYTAQNNNSSAIAVNGTKKFGGGSGKTVEFDVPGDTVTFGYRSDSSGCGNGYGYYAVVTGSGGGLIITNRSITDPAPESGALTLRKQVRNNTSTKKEYFKFHVKLSSTDADLTKMLSGEQVYGTTTFQDGEAVVYLAADEELSLTDLPSGIHYEITEEENEDYDVTWTSTAGTAAANVYSGDIVANTTADITCVNTKTSSGTPDNPMEYGTLKITKTFVNVPADKMKATLKIAFWGLEKNKEYTVQSGKVNDSFYSDANGYGNDELRVTLISEGSLIMEGMEDSIRVADAGTQDGDQGVMPARASDDGSSVLAETWIITGLPAGCQYQIMEDPSEGLIASYEITGASKITQSNKANASDNQSLTTAKETIQANETTTVAFTNTAKETPKDADTMLAIGVEKTWDDNDDALKIRPKNITIQLTQDGDVIATAVLDESTGWKSVFEDLDKYAEDGVTEYVYAINELEVPGYQSTIKKETDPNIIQNDMVDYAFFITNSLVDVGNLKVSKTVEGDGADVSQAFRFTIKLMKDGAPLKGTFQLDAVNGTKTGSIAFDENGQATVNLKHNESVVISDLPAGTSYQVTETQTPGYIASNNGVYNGTIKQGETAEVNMTNTVSPSCKLTVTKTVKGNQGNKTKDFNFQLALKGSSVPTTLTYTKNGKKGQVNVVNGIAKFTLTHEGTITFNDVPSGITYTVTETDGESNGYTVSSKNASGKLVQDTTASFTNTKNVGLPTGAMTNTIAIIVVLAGCVAGILLLVTKKRSKHR